MENKNTHLHGWNKSAVGKFLAIIVVIGCLSLHLNAQSNMNTNQALTATQQSIIPIAAYTATGHLQELKSALNNGLNAGLTISEIKEIMVHLYAYCGFPRSIRGLQTLMEVLDQRKAQGIIDKKGAEASPVNQEKSKYERGKKILEELTKTPQEGPLTGYSAFAPAIDTFLKEHLFADIFERDVLTYSQRELVTISVLSAIGGVEPMLRSHLGIALNVGFTPQQLNEFIGVINSTLGEGASHDAQVVLNEVLKVPQPQSELVIAAQEEAIFPKGDKIPNDNFTGTAYHYPIITPDSIYQIQVGSVTFEPKARTHWHKHPAGQILLVTAGKGFYQEKGKARQLIRKGDIVKIPPATEHWHGAAPDSSLTHIAINPNIDKGKVNWLIPVTDQEYNGQVN